jgi:hypothetical protein
MLNDRNKKVFVTVAGTLGVVMLAPVLLYMANGTRRDSKADVAPRDVPTRAAVHSISPPNRRNVPLASIPWKRDCDTFSAVMLPCARLPWFRNVDPTPSASAPSTEVPLPPRSDAYEPVFLPTMSLPWRY